MYPRGRMPGGEVIYLNGEGAMSERLFKFLFVLITEDPSASTVKFLGAGWSLEVPVDQLDQRVWHDCDVLSANSNSIAN